MVVVAGLQSTLFWNNAKKNAYEEVPKILHQIEKTARSVIHGEQAPT